MIFKPRHRWRFQSVNTVECLWFNREVCGKTYRVAKRDFKRMVRKHSCANNLRGRFAIVQGFSDRNNQLDYDAKAHLEALLASVPMERVMSHGGFPEGFVRIRFSQSVGKTTALLHV